MNTGVTDTSIEIRPLSIGVGWRVLASEHVALFPYHV